MDPEAQTLILQQDLLVNILSYSEDIGKCAEQISSRIREIIGTKIVALFEQLPEGRIVLAGVCPERKKELFEDARLKSFIAKAGELQKPSFIRPGNGEMGRILAELSMQESFVIPLRIKEESLGMLVLLDIMDKKGIEQILSGLKDISGLLSLIIRNSFLYRHMEDLVDQKTRALKESEQRYRDLFDQANEGLMIMDLEGNIAEANKAFASMHGYTADEIKKIKIYELNILKNNSFQIIPSILEKLNRGEPARMEVNHYHKDGRILTLSCTVSRIRISGQEYFFGFHQDITEKKNEGEEKQKLLQKLHQSQKLESLGLLAGGLAHDFNNLLGGIMGYIEMATLTSPLNPEASSYLSTAVSTITRARGLTQQLLTFAKGGAPIKKIESLILFLKESVEFALTGSNVKSFFDIPQNLWPCDMDKNQITQVVDNIVINAKQAMADGGRITIRAQNISFKKNDPPLLEANHYVRIEIIDTGIGMPKGILDKIFDPFFSTKATGHGLGLATCYSIIKRHGGAIDVQSEPGKGSTFCLYLPAHSDSVLQTEEPRKACHKGSGTFLVMDDEHVICATVSAMLKTMGYTPVCMENGEKALHYFQEASLANQAIAGMLFDLTVPGGMGGKEAVLEIRKINQEIPVFVSSGYADDPVMAQPRQYGFTASISKPFLRSEFAKLLSQHMNHATP